MASGSTSVSAEVALSRGQELLTNANLQNDEALRVEALTKILDAERRIAKSRRANLGPAISERLTDLGAQDPSFLERALSGELDAVTLLEAIDPKDPELSDDERKAVEADPEAIRVVLLSRKFGVSFSTAHKALNSRAKQQGFALAARTRSSTDLERFLDRFLRHKKR